MLQYLKKYSLLLVFTFFIGLFSLLDVLTVPQTFSELENRPLAKKPSLSLNKFLDGSYSPQYEKFVNDQFIRRNDWISIKSRAEYALGKIENNGVIYGADGYMFEKLQSFNEATLANNIKSIAYFIDTYKLPTSFILIPNSYAILEDKLPKGAYMIDQLALIDTVYKSLPKEMETVDVSPTLLKYHDNYIYYRTDHHWTTYGAYLTYSEWIKSLGMKPMSLAELTPTTVENFYGTYFSKTKAFNAISDTITYYPVKADITIDGKTYPSLYDSSKWDARDKYAGFLWGNNGITVIKSKVNRYQTPNQTSRLLVFKDSFGNSLVPFLTYHFDEIHVIDLRAMPTKLSEYMNTYTFDHVLIGYNLTNFLQDTNISRIKQ